MREVRGSKLCIAGRGELEDELKAYVLDNQLNNVEFLGHLNSDELSHLIQNARFSILPSEWYENYSMAVIESLASGTPVIGSRMGGIPERIRDGWNGLLFNAGDAQQLAEKINLLLDNSQMALEMGRNGRAQVEQVNSPQRHCELTLDVYHSLLASAN